MIKQMLEMFGIKNYIANLGHGIHLDAIIDSVKHFVETVHHVAKGMIKIEVLSKTINSNRQ
jgi:uroporphyrinogen-III decarboxylase